MITQPLEIDLDLSGVSTAQPLIRHGHVGRVRLADISGVKNDSNQTVALKWEFRLVEPAPAQDAEGSPLPDVNANYPIFVRINLGQDFLLVKQAKFMDALLGTGDKNNTKGKPDRPNLNAAVVASMVGREAIARVSVSHGKTGYVGNDIDKLEALA